MATCVGRSFLPNIWKNGVKNLNCRVVIVRCKSSATKEAKIDEEVLAKNIPGSEPGKVQAAILKKISSPLIIENIELPKNLQPNEVLISVHYCAVNPSDFLLSKDDYICEPILPKILGHEIVGQISQIGEEAEKNGYKIGDKVVALNKEKFGGLAEKCVADMNDIWKVPSSIKSIDATCLLDNYITSLMALERKVSLEEDEMVIINVGLSNLGLAAVDIAANVFRAKVIAVCATEDGAAVVRDKGAYESLKFNDKKLLKSIKEIAGDREIKAIFDGEAGEYFKKIIKSFTDIYNNGNLSLKNMLRDDNFGIVVQHLSREGRVVVAGTAATMDNAHAHVQNGSFTVTGFNLADYKIRKPEVYREAGDNVLQFLEEGLVTPSYSLTTGFYNINEAFGHFNDMTTFKKAVIDIRNKNAPTEVKK
ncbi:quinone oxidoreductase-like protein 2 [Prorops nasuta]|uniref:quinone oxidoreductase-like protein 2 n=1 Tax=Prorops nasuta TaxID=863751 RepID=UPI0034CE06C3